MDIIWDAVTAYHVQGWVKKSDVLMDLGCGDGYFSALMFGAKIPLTHDRFLNVVASNQKIKTNQSGDIYRNQQQLLKFEKAPWRRVDFGLELKPHHIRVADSLGIYKKIIKGIFEETSLNERSIDKVYSIFAFYWGRNLDRQINEIYRILREDGEFIVTLPSEHLSGMHICKRLADEEKSKKVRLYLENLDGGRKDLTTRHSRSEKGWKDWFEYHNFKVLNMIPVVNKVMFLHQDISQRVFLPILFKMSNSEDFKRLRSIVKKYVCEKLYPDLLSELLKFESDHEVEHAYYLFRVKKIAKNSAAKFNRECQKPD
ncbi:MAG: methyltransferase domain-containing protein [Candidatus Omnitrophica bacterium]|nr:methyltransferase domain-containing protein [Candidatus Omnitrophota bacterium]